jgi:predicted kinase
VSEKSEAQEFYILAGLPGSGKSTYARRLKSERGTFVVSSDTIRLALNAGIYPRDAQNGDYTILEPVVWSLVRQAVVLLLRAGYSVALDATNLTKARRAYWQRIARSVVPGIGVTIVWCTGHWDSPARWQQERGCSLDEYWQIRRKLEAAVEIPTPDEASKVLFR